MTSSPTPAVLTDARALPDVLPGHWSSAAGRDMAIRTLADRNMAHNRERISDFALANEVFLSPGIDNLTDAKERIRWLSAQLAFVLATPPASDAAVPADAVEAAARAMCDRVNGLGDYDENVDQRRTGWIAQAKAGIAAYLSAAAPKVASDTGAGLPLIGGGIVLYARGGYAVSPAGKPFPPSADAYTFYPLPDAVTAAIATPTYATDGEARYLIRKGGYYYRPNAHGYTSHKAEAGRYTLAEAVRHSHPNGPDGPRDGMDYVLDTDATDGATGGGEVQQGGKLGWDADGMCDDHYRFACKECTLPATTPGGDLLEQAADSEKSLRFVIVEAKHNLRLTQGCMECNAEDERRWSETIEWLEGLA